MEIIHISVGVIIRVDLRRFYVTLNRILTSCQLIYVILCSGYIYIYVNLFNSLY